VILKADSQGEMSGEFFDGGLRKFGASRSSLPFRAFLRFRNFVLHKADIFSAISPEIVNELRLSGVPSEKIELIPNSVDISCYVPVNDDQKQLLRKKLNLPATAAIVLYTGRLVSYKGLPLLLKVWNEILREHSDGLLVLVGAGGLDIHNCEHELREYVQSAGIQRFVLFTGAVRNVAEYLQAADVFAFPTANDAFPSSVIEAIKDIISNGKNGLLIEPGNAAQLFDALETILTDENLAARLGQFARQTVEERYSAGQVTIRYFSLFDRLLRQRASLSQSL
jgi:glycosyltransferase involved in cell wall biosynthesis